MKNVPRNLKSYFVCLLRKGERWNDIAGAEELGAQHLAFMREQIEARHFLFAGPVTDENPIRGVTVIEAASIEEAKELVSQDPSILAARLSAEILPVYFPSLDAVRVEF